MTERDLVTKADLRNFERSLKSCFIEPLTIQAMAIVGLIELFK
jgi:hypothetical protein